MDNNPLNLKETGIIFQGTMPRIAAGARLEFVDQQSGIVAAGLMIRHWLDQAPGINVLNLVQKWSEDSSTPFAEPLATAAGIEEFDQPAAPHGLAALVSFLAAQRACDVSPESAAEALRQANFSDSDVFGDGLKPAAKNSKKPGWITRFFQKEENNYEENNPTEESDSDGADAPQKDQAVDS